MEYTFLNQKLGFRNVYNNRVEILEKLDMNEEAVNAYKLLMAYTDSIYTEEDVPVKVVKKLEATKLTNDNDFALERMHELLLYIFSELQPMKSFQCATFFPLVVDTTLYFEFCCKHDKDIRFV